MRRLRSLLVCFIVLIVCVNGLSAAVAEDLTQKGDQNRQRQQEIEEQLKLARASDAGVEAEVARLTKALASQRSKAAEAQQAQLAAKSSAEDAARRLADVEARAAQARGEMARRAIEAYSHPSKGGGFFTMTQSASFDDAVRRQSYLTVVQGRTIDAIGALRAVREDQADAKTALENAQALAEKRATAEKDQAEALAGAQRIQQAASDQLQGRIGALELEGRQLAAQEAQIQALIRAEAAPPPPVTVPAPQAITSPQAAPRPTSPVAAARPSSSGFIWPISGVVTSEYGPRWGSFHPGIDIAGPDGGAIVAAKKGVVIYAAFNDGGYGNFVIIDHGDGFVTAYAHQSRLAVSRGQSVSQGQVIGYEGSTGFSTGPHLHFEVRSDGSAKDPRSYVSGSP